MKAIIRLSIVYSLIGVLVFLGFLGMIRWLSFSGHPVIALACIVGSQLLSIAFLVLMVNPENKVKEETATEYEDDRFGDQHPYYCDH